MSDAQGEPRLIDYIWRVKKKKKVSNDQGLIQSDPISCPQNETGNKEKCIHWQQFTKGTRGKPNEQLFPSLVVIQLPKYVTHIIGELKYKYGQQEQVTVSDHNRSTALELSVLGDLNRFYGSLHGIGERKFVQMFQVTWPRWPPCPYMLKTLKNRN